MLKQIAFSFVFVLSMSVNVLAQDAGFYNHGYGFFGVGSKSGTAEMHLGGGGEAGIHKGFGIGGEIGYLAPFRHFGSGFGIFSANGVYQFREAGTSLTPFVTAGYSLGFRHGTASGFNFGAGLHHPLNDKTGLRMEIRDHVLDFGSLQQFYSFRIGLSFH